MSATNRGGLQRHEHDFYETPTWAVDLVLTALGIGESFDGYVVDPGCGTGAIAHCVAQRAPKADVRGIELQSHLLDTAKAKRASTIAWECQNWLSWQPDGTPDFVISNPPFGPKNEPRLAEKFVRKALDVVARKGTVAMLLRLGYLVPKSRRELRDAFGRPDVLALEKRPSFNRSGTDATDYAWIVWGPKRTGRFAVLR